MSTLNESSTNNISGPLNQNDSNIQRFEILHGDRVERWFILFVRLLTLLSTNVIVALFLYHHQVGKCSTKLNQLDCRSQNYFDPLGANVCEWSSGNQSCEDVTDIHRQLLFVIVVGGLIVNILRSFVDKFFTFVLGVAHVAFKNRRMHWFYCCFNKSNRIAARTPAPTVPMTTTNHAGTSKSTRQIQVSPAALDSHSGSASTHTDILGNDKDEAFMTKILSTKPGTELQQLLALEERGLEHFGDELKSFRNQSKQATMLRAVRLTIMKQKLDFCSSEEEYQWMIDHKEKHFWLDDKDKAFRTNNWFDALRDSFKTQQFYWFDISDPHTALELMDHARIYRKQLVIDRLKRSRHRAVDVRTSLLQKPDDFARDRYLVQRYLADFLWGYKRAIAHSIFFEEEDYTRWRQERVIWQYLALVIVPLFIIIACAIIFYGGMQWRFAASQMWLYCLVCSLIIQQVLVQPFRIWFLSVWCPTLAKWDILCLHWVLFSRARTILARKSGLLMNVNALTQHFHPACRAARLVPHLASSRILMSLSDFDVPFTQILARPRRRSKTNQYPTVQVVNTGSPLVYDRCEAICFNIYSKYRWLYKLIVLLVLSILRLLLHNLYLLPQWCRECLVECAALVVVCGYLYALLLVTAQGFQSTTNILVLAILLMLLPGVAVGITIIKARRWIRRENQRLSLLARQKRFRMGLPPLVEKSKRMRWSKKAPTMETAEELKGDLV
mmetsp:Transcript_11695/g.19575  ORF Transcript_11695/g.19575 Transcript_11695/m.19575 type:complete len:725 (+) Transcript_11695:188-2362(+)